MQFDAKALMEAAFLGNPQEVLDLYTQKENFDVVIEKDDQTYAGEYEGDDAWIGTSGADYFEYARRDSELFVGGEGNDYFKSGAVVIPTEETKLAPDRDALLSSAVQKVNEQLNQSERVRKYVVQEMICSTDNGLLTPTQKVKRDAVLSRNETEIQALY